jgi:hypothetical protein
LQGRTGGRSVVFSGQLTFVVVASCWSSSGDVELSMLLLPHTRTHLQHTKQKKKFAPITRTVGVTIGPLH